MRSTATSPAGLGTILSIWAHPDDETYLAGGLMAAAADRGQRVVCVSVTAGEHGTSDAESWPPSRLGPVRRREAAVAMAVLGISEHCLLGMPDGGLAAIDDEIGTARIARLLDDVRPDTILTFGPDGMTYHPDHIAVHRWVTRAWEQRRRRPRLLYAAPTATHLARFGDLYEAWDMYMTEERPVGVAEEALAVHVELAGAALDRKLAALLAMPSQTGDLVRTIGLPTYASQVAEEAFVDARRAA